MRLVSLATRFCFLCLLFSHANFRLLPEIHSDSRTKVTSNTAFWFGRGKRGKSTGVSLDSVAKKEM